MHFYYNRVANLEYPTRALQAGRTDIGRHCNSVETAQPGDRTTNPGIVMPERNSSSQRVDSLARVVITPVRHTHTRLHMYVCRPRLRPFDIFIYLLHVKWSNIKYLSKLREIFRVDRVTTVDMMMNGK